MEKITIVAIIMAVLAMLSGGVSGFSYGKKNILKSDNKQEEYKNQIDNLSFISKITLGMFIGFALLAIILGITSAVQNSNDETGSTDPLPTSPTGPNRPTSPTGPNRPTSPTGPTGPTSPSSNSNTIKGRFMADNYGSVYISKSGSGKIAEYIFTVNPFTAPTEFISTIEPGDELRFEVRNDGGIGAIKAEWTWRGRMYKTGTGNDNPFSYPVYAVNSDAYTVSTISNGFISDPKPQAVWMGLPEGNITYNFIWVAPGGAAFKRDWTNGFDGKNIISEYNPRYCMDSNNQQVWECNNNPNYQQWYYDINKKAIHSTPGGWVLDIPRGELPGIDEARNIIIYKPQITDNQRWIYDPDTHQIKSVMNNSFCIGYDGENESHLNIRKCDTRNMRQKWFIPP